MSHRPCQSTTKSGAPCTIDAGPRGLCHVHDPDAAYALQHPGTREALLARDDVQQALRNWAASQEATQTSDTGRGVTSGDRGRVSSELVVRGVWDEWGDLTRFLESARLAFDRERQLWSSLEIADPSAVTLAAPAGDGNYRVSLGQHLETLADDHTLCASVLIHSYALAETTALDRLDRGLNKGKGIEDWGQQLLESNGSTWTDVIGGKAGAVEVAVMRNACTHGGRRLGTTAVARLARAGAPDRPADVPLSLTYSQL